MDMLKIKIGNGYSRAPFAGIWGTLVVAWTNPDASFKTNLLELSHFWNLLW